MSTTSSRKTLSILSKEDVAKLQGLTGEALILKFKELTPVKTSTPDVLPSYARFDKDQKLWYTTRFEEIAMTYNEALYEQVTGNGLTSFFNSLADFLEIIMEMTDNTLDRALLSREGYNRIFRPILCMFILKSCDDEDEARSYALFKELCGARMSSEICSLVNKVFNATGYSLLNLEKDDLDWATVGIWRFPVTAKEQVDQLRLLRTFLNHYQKDDQDRKLGMPHILASELLFFFATEIGPTQVAQCLSVSTYIACPRDWLPMRDITSRRLRANKNREHNSIYATHDTVVSEMMRTAQAGADGIRYNMDGVTINTKYPIRSRIEVWCPEKFKLMGKILDGYYQLNQQILATRAVFQNAMQCDAESFDFMHRANKGPSTLPTNFFFYPIREELILPDRRRAGMMDLVRGFDGEARYEGLAAFFQRR